MNNEPVAIPFAWYCAWLDENNQPVWDQYEECHPATKQWDNFPDKTIPLYTHPVKELHLSLQKSKQTGELLAVTYTDDEHRIVEVLWQRPPAKELTDDVAKYHYNKGHEDGRKLAVVEQITDEEIADFLYAYCLDMGDVYEASEEQFIKCVRAILRKAQGK